ncbi:hypothetical protein Rsub_00413 [Raphidocelis subcapitata]|uniref:FAS1 domain-containing protein n=1 Tax=Raphidocelis subcapitata TaxID=307507 RepID=A0A2V0NMQ2_9CHLO|nr:hypothetical protein Rsub_00413 [Raphidocelis subcapitata]|eukprot:GBF87702.1 hypothetical protein Rsub_00413 [Raphidocelis subcapitata]
MGVIRGDDYMTSYLKKPDLVITAFPSTNAATKSFLSSVSKYAGVALQNETFTRGVFGHMIVPGKAWTAAELAKAAPLNLKTLHGDLLRVTKSPEAPYGVLIDGSPIALANQAAADGKVVLHLVEGNLFPDDSLQQVAAWRTASHPTAAMKLQEAAPAAKDAPAAAVASGSAGAGAGARVGAGAAAGAAALLALLL